MEKSLQDRIEYLLKNVEHEDKGSFVVSGECFDLIQAHEWTEKMTLLGLINLDDGAHVEGIETTNPPISVLSEDEMKMALICQDADNIVLSTKQAKSLVEALTKFLNQQEEN